MRSFRLLNLRYIFASVLALSSCVYVSAHDFEENGLYYDIIRDGSGVSVVVGKEYLRGGGIRSLFATGNVSIPARTQEGYKVVKIRSGALCGAISVSIPSTVKTIGEVYAYTELGSGFVGWSCMRTIAVDPANPVFDSRGGCNAIIRTADNVLIAGSSSTVIPGDVTGIAANAFVGNELLKKVVIPDSVTYIGNEAFRNCTGLVEVVLPENLDSIGDYAFSGCTKLTSIKLPEKLTSIGEGVFDGCTSLTDIELPKALSHIGDYAFRGCASLTGGMQFENLSKIGKKAFYGCASLESVALPKEMMNIEEGAFYGCKSLRNLSLPDSLASIGAYAFYKCAGLEEIELCGGVAIGSSAFAYCEGLIKVTFVANNDAKEGSARIGDNAFLDCVSLKEVHLSKCVDHIGELVFEGCNNLKRIVVEEGNKNYDSRDNCNAVIRTLKEVDPTSGDTIRQDEVFIGCKETVIPKSVSVIGAYAFSGDFTNIAIPEWITEIKSDAFVRCRKVTTVYSHSITPPMVYIKPGGLGSFYNSSAAKLFVPVGSKLSYSNPMVDWCLFGDIVEWSKITPMPGSDGVVVYDTSAIDEIEIDHVLGEDGEAAEYYNLQGVKVENPANGVFNKKQGGKTTKVVL